MTQLDLDLDVATPEELPQVLRRAAEQFAQSESELQSAWTDPNAGRVWREFSKILERAAKSADKAIFDHV
jgi:hypothetical protein